MAVAVVVEEALAVVAEEVEVMVEALAVVKEDEVEVEAFTAVAEEVEAMVVVVALAVVEVAEVEAFAVVEEEEVEVTGGEPPTQAGMVGVGMGTRTTLAWGVAMIPAMFPIRLKVVLAAHFWVVSVKFTVIWII